METELYSLRSSSPEETSEAGRRLAEYYADPDFPPFVALYGDLGVGKTEFVRGFASLLSPGSAVRSPTYTLVNEYGKGARPVCHFDVYRIQDEDDLYSTGFYDYPERGICLVEWCDLIPYALPPEYVTVTIEKVPENVNERIITVRLTVRGGKTE